VRRLLDWLDERMGWRKVKAALLDRKIPKGVNWAYTLGSLLAFLIVLQAVTGIILAMHYSPSPDHAYQSLQYLQSEVFMGSFIRGLHRWGASAMVLVAFLHMLRVYFMAAYKYPREMTWVSGVLLMLVVVAFGFTGYLLPWDQKAYWATMVGSKIAASTPLLGPYLGRVLKGGDDLGALTLTRFYGIHMLVLPAALLALVAVHLFLVVWHGISAPPVRYGKHPPKGDWHAEDHHRYLRLKEEGKPFFPDIVAKDMVVVMAGLAVLVVLAHWVGAKLEPLADPTDIHYNPRPEWYFLFLFQLLKAFPGSLETLATMVIPGLGLAFLFMLPFLDQGPRRHFRDRPFLTGLGVLAVCGIATLTAQGALAPNTNIAQAQDPKIEAGKRLFRELRCASCHSINGSGGLVGPALDLEGTKRERKWLAGHFRDPQSLKPGSKMPNFKLLDGEVEVLVDYMGSLGVGPVFSPAAPKLFEQDCMDCHIIKGKGDDSGPDLSREGETREQGWIAEYIRSPDRLYDQAEMPGFEKKLTPAQIDDLANYLSAQRPDKARATWIKKDKR
jgi:ubiquinol-cytochrome c reductase cytochrome b subunit